MSTIIGIDLGTTNSLAAYLAEDGPQVIANALGEPLTPSVVGLDRDDKLLVGRAAKELQVLEPDELMVQTQVYDQAARRRSLELTMGVRERLAAGGLD